ncbi:MAG: hypothetical protein R3299_00465 [Arenibacter sp.]|nr:hypothetical protein [Arenibacter sp.]
MGRDGLLGLTILMSCSKDEDGNDIETYYSVDPKNHDKATGRVEINNFKKGDQLFLERATPVFPEPLMQSFISIWGK